MISYIEFLGTHQKIDFASYISAFGKLFNKKRFPNYNWIEVSSGALGPDMLWLRGLQKSSWHVYNPRTKKGGACTAVQRFYDKLVMELSKKRPKMRKAGKYAAWLSHFIVDALTPSHQEGRYKIKEPIKDWFDPHWDENKSPVLNFWKNHALFEIRIALMYMFKKLNRAKMNKKFIKTCRQKFRTDKVKEYIEKKSREVYKLKIYDVYKRLGFNKNVKMLITRRLVPIMVSTVATVWRNAYIESLEIRKNAIHNT
ncbi:MAG: hypothetical protein U9R08_00600 [Nanoarchaeota archaeon]|nr:hypothetical protein [Nanoarchaeota archaeon]